MTTSVAEAVVRAVRDALAEDLDERGDLTSQLLDPDRWADATIVAREGGVLAGTACALETFRAVDDTITAELRHQDGDRVKPGEPVVELRGPLHSILTAERTALNFLGHLSGIATATRAVVDAVRAVSGTVQVLDTRKTLPGLRTLEKAAVRAGGGTSHRATLSESVLLKDNHLAVLGITAAVAAARQHFDQVRVQVECDTEAQVSEALEAGADAVLLDNMSPALAARCVALVRAVHPATFVEASGGITAATAAAYAAAGVDAVSAGALTHSARAMDLSLEVLAG